MRVRRLALLIATMPLSCATGRSDGAERAAAAFLHAVVADDWKQCAALLDQSALHELQDKVVVLAKRHENIVGSAEGIRDFSPDEYFTEYAKLNSYHFHRWIGCNSMTSVDLITSTRSGADWNVVYRATSDSTSGGSPMQLAVRETPAGWRVLLPSGISDALQSLIDAGV